MLQITIRPGELWDEGKQEFVYKDGRTLQLEHSLVSVSKWESKWCKSFLSKSAKTYEETIDYVRCMTLTQNVDPEIYRYLSDENLDQVNKYIEAPMTATFINKEQPKSTSKEPITSELIYYWMIAHNIPFECRKWHLNRLLTLIDVCNIKSQPPKKHSRKELMQRNSALNAARRKRHNTRG